MSFGDEFLTQPDLFPARDSGELWGSKQMSLEFSGGPYLFRGLSETHVELLSHRYGDLLGAETSADEPVEIQVFRVAGSDFCELTPIPGRPYAMDLDYRSSMVNVAAPRLMGRISLEPLRAALWTSVEEPLKHVIGIFENFFRLLVAYRLNQAGGALLHSAAVVRDSQAYLFLGRSGAGKSTISKINQDAGFEVLSDDMNALVIEEGRAVVEKLPFAGDLGQTGERRGGAPLAGIFRLEKSDHHALHPLPQPQALALLLSCSPYLNADRHRTDRLMENLVSLVQACNVKRLTFRRDPEFWDLIMETF